jgi:hypothetical protein
VYNPYGEHWRRGCWKKTGLPGPQGMVISVQSQLLKLDITDYDSFQHKGFETWGFLVTCALVGMGEGGSGATT